MKTMPTPLPELLLLLALLMLPTAVPAQYTYDTINGGILITGYTGSSGALTIPSAFGSLPVTGIAADSFVSDNGNLTSVIIPGSVTNLQSQAFGYCGNLTGVFFLGNAPHSNAGIFTSGTGVTVYYLPGTTGWGPTFSGVPAVLWNPPLPALGIATYSNQPVVFFPVTASIGSNPIGPNSIGTNYVLQMTTNSASTNWVTISNTIPFIIIRPQMTNLPGSSFFRLKFQ
jgi:hypothetical protein